MESKKELNPFLETLGLLYVEKNFEAVKKDLLLSLSEMHIHGEQFYRQNLAYLESYVGEFQKFCVLEPEDEFFFGHNTEFFLIALATAVELFDSGADRTHLNREQVYSVISKFLKQEQTTENRISDSMEEWFAVLQKTECSEDTKWKLLEFLNAPADKIQKLFELYEENRAAFDATRKKNKKHLEKLLLEAPAEISDTMYHVMSVFYPGEKKIYFTAIFPLIEWLTPTAIFQGVLADKVDLYQKNIKNAKEMLPQLLKLLGDKSKFEILCLLKSHGRYNLEIAEKLQLTPATASHHMSMLLSNQMVMVEKKDGRVYYQLNRETLKEIVRYFEEIFL